MGTRSAFVDPHGIVRDFEQSAHLLAQGHQLAVTRPQQELAGAARPALPHAPGRFAVSGPSLAGRLPPTPPFLPVTVISSSPSPRHDARVPGPSGAFCGLERVWGAPSGTAPARGVTGDGVLIPTIPVSGRRAEPCAGLSAAAGRGSGDPATPWWPCVSCRVCPSPVYFRTRPFIQRTELPGSRADDGILAGDRTPWAQKPKEEAARGSQEHRWPWPQRLGRQAGPGSCTQPPAHRCPDAPGLGGRVGVQRREPRFSLAGGGDAPAGQGTSARKVTC